MMEEKEIIVVQHTPIAWGQAPILWGQAPIIWGQAENPVFRASARSVVQNNGKQLFRNKGSRDQGSGNQATRDQVISRKLRGT
jgi:hypothetical protein